MIATTIVCSNMFVSSDVSGQKQLALPLICKRFLRVSSFSVCSNNWVTLFEFTIILHKSRQILIEDVILRAKLGVSVVRSKNSPLRTQDIHAQNHPPPPPTRTTHTLLYCKHRPPTLVTQATNYGKDRKLFQGKGSTICQSNFIWPRLFSRSPGFFWFNLSN